MTEQTVFTPIETNGAKKLKAIAITIIAGFVITSIFLIMRAISFEENMREQVPYTSHDSFVVIFTILLISIILIMIVFLFALLIHGVNNLRYILGDNLLIIQFGLIKKNIPYTHILKVFNAPKGYFQPYLPRLKAKSGASGLALGKFYCEVDGSLNKLSQWGTSKEDLIIFSVLTGKDELKYFGITPEMKWNFIKELMSHDVDVIDLEFD